jgi:uncharacterized protein YwqG
LGRIRKTAVPPTPSEARQADDLLERSLRAAVFGELGGFRPESTEREGSWWGGCALAQTGQDIPTGRSGNPMQPVLQIRCDDVGMDIPGLEGVALLVFWLDLDGNMFEAVEGTDFAVFTYPGLDDLVPIGPGYKETDRLSVLPIRWRDPIPQQPSWDDMAGKLPERVAWSDTIEWFHDNPLNKAAEELQVECPVKVGGWPTWIQGSQWEGKEATEAFVLQIDSSDKGRLYLGDSGSLYLFREKASGAWHMRTDCF